MPVRAAETSAPPQHHSGSNCGHTSPPPFTRLSVGQGFSGTQNVSSLQKDEAWRVNVRTQGCDLENGYLCGTMEALNVPMADTPVVTFWEGEIVDTKNYTFFTEKWEATHDDDIRHWTKFPSFSALLSRVEVDGGKSLDLSNYKYIFMVVTFWEGEIVDTKNYNFFTEKWEATPEDDISHLTKFPSFSALLSQVEVDGGKSLDLSN